MKENDTKAHFELLTLTNKEVVLWFGYGVDVFIQTLVC